MSMNRVTSKWVIKWMSHVTCQWHVDVTSEWVIHIYEVWCMYVYSYINTEYDNAYVHLFIYSYTHIMYGIIYTYNHTYMHIDICFRYDCISVNMYIRICLHRYDKWFYIWMNVRIFIWNIFITFDYILYWHCDSSTHKLSYFVYVYICFCFIYVSSCICNIICMHVQMYPCMHLYIYGWLRP